MPQTILGTLGNRLERPPKHASIDLGPWWLTRPTKQKWLLQPITSVKIYYDWLNKFWAANIIKNLAVLRVQVCRQGTFPKFILVTLSGRFVYCTYYEISPWVFSFRAVHCSLSLAETFQGSNLQRTGSLDQRPAGVGGNCTLRVVAACCPLGLQVTAGSWHFCWMKFQDLDIGWKDYIVAKCSISHPIVLSSVCTCANMGVNMLIPRYEYVLCMHDMQICICSCMS